MEEETEMIVVDDVEEEEDEAGPSNLGAGSTNPDSQYGTRSRSGIAVGSRLRSASQASTQQTPVAVTVAAAAEAPSNEASRATRSSASRPKIQATKLKLKLGEKQTTSMAPGMSFLGPYDRELDSDDEELEFEEQFILRMPPGEDCDKFRKMVNSREISNDVFFKFKDSRRAQFTIGTNTYSAKLVDLPCVIESQKTLDNKQMFKVADICQMMVLDKQINPDEPLGTKNFNIEEFIYPHGSTPPLKHVRKRRFRKRINRRTIESVEKEVERLLDEDSLAADVKYEILDNVNPDLSDSEFIEREETTSNATPAAASDAGDAPTPAGGADDDDEDDDGDIDEELAAELDEALGNEEDDESDDNSSESGEDESGDEGSGDEEMVQSRRLVNEEIRDLENVVANKQAELSGTFNALIRQRIEGTIKKLTAELEVKRAARDEMIENARREKEGDPPEPQEPQNKEDGDDLFGDDEMDTT